MTTEPATAKRGRGRPRKDGMPVQQKRLDANFTRFYQVTKKIAAFREAVIKEMQDHPNSVADSLCIEGEYMYIVLKRKENGINHSLDIEVRYDE